VESKVGIDEESSGLGIDWNGQVLPESDKSVVVESVSFYADVFAIHDRSDREAWGIARSWEGCVANFALSSGDKRWIRSALMEESLILSRGIHDGDLETGPSCWMVRVSRVLILAIGGRKPGRGTRLGDRSRSNDLRARRGRWGYRGYRVRWARLRSIRGSCESL
jgi:hypothetical protein